MSTARIVHQAGDASSKLDAVVRDLRGVLEDLEDGWNGVRAQHYDPSDGAVRLWCEDHERDLAACEAVELGCIGVTDQRRAGDSTGEAALLDGDRDRAAYRDIERAVDAVERAVAKLDRLVEVNSPRERNAAALAVAKRQAAAFDDSASGSVDGGRPMVIEVGAADPMPDPTGYPLGTVARVSPTETYIATPDGWDWIDPKEAARP